MTNIIFFVAVEDDESSSSSSSPDHNNRDPSSSSHHSLENLNLVTSTIITEVEETDPNLGEIISSCTTQQTKHFSGCMGWSATSSASNLKNISCEDELIKTVMTNLWFNSVKEWFHKLTLTPTQSVMDSVVSVSVSRVTKVVIKVSMNNAKSRRKAMMIAISVPGAISAELQGDSNNQLLVTGNGIDAICLTKMIRKKVGFTELVSVTPIPEKKKKKSYNRFGIPEKKEKKKSYNRFGILRRNYLQRN